MATFIDRAPDEIFLKVFSIICHATEPNLGWHQSVTGFNGEMVGSATVRYGIKGDGHNLMLVCPRWHNIFKVNTATLWKMTIQMNTTSDGDIPPEISISFLEKLLVALTSPSNCDIDIYMHSPGPRRVYNDLFAIAWDYLINVSHRWRRVFLRGVCRIDNGFCPSHLPRLEELTVDDYVVGEQPARPIELSVNEENDGSTYPMEAPRLKSLHLSTYSLLVGPVFDSLRESYLPSLGTLTIQSGIPNIALEVDNSLFKIVEGDRQRHRISSHSLTTLAFTRFGGSESHLLKNSTLPHLTVLSLKAAKSWALATDLWEKKITLPSLRLLCVTMEDNWTGDFNRGVRPPGYQPPASNALNCFGDLPNLTAMRLKGSSKWLSDITAPSTTTNWMVLLWKVRDLDLDISGDEPLEPHDSHFLGRLLICLTDVVNIRVSKDEEFLSALFAAVIIGVVHGIHKIIDAKNFLRKWDKLIIGGVMDAEWNELDQSLLVDMIIAREVHHSSVLRVEPRLEWLNHRLRERRLVLSRRGILSEPNAEVLAP